MYDGTISVSDYIGSLRDFKKNALLTEILSYIPKGKDALEFDTKYKSEFPIYHKKYVRQGKLYAICNNRVMVKIPSEHNERVAYMTHIPFSKMTRTTLIEVLIDLLYYIEWKHNNS